MKDEALSGPIRTTVATEERDSALLIALLTFPLIAEAHQRVLDAEARRLKIILDNLGLNAACPPMDGK